MQSLGVYILNITESPTMHSVIRVYSQTNCTDFINRSSLNIIEWNNTSVVSIESHGEGALSVGSIVKKNIFV